MCHIITTQEFPTAQLGLESDRRAAAGHGDSGPGDSGSPRIGPRSWPGPEGVGPHPLSDWALPAATLALLLESLLGHVGAYLLLAAAVVFGARPGRRRLWLPTLGLSLAALLANDLLLPGLRAAGSAGLARLAAYALEGMLLGSLVVGLEGAGRRAAGGGLAALRPRLAPARGEARLRILLDSSHQSRERFQMLVKGAKDYGIFLLDPGGRIASWSGGAERITGYQSAEVLNRYLDRVCPGDGAGRDEAQRWLATAAAEGRAEGEGPCARRDGTSLWVHCGLSALRDEAGTLRGFAAVLRDVTGRHRAEEALRRAHDELEARVRERTAELARANEILRTEVAERRRAEEALRRQSGLLRSILDTMPAAVLVVDEDQRLVHYNPAAERLFGPAPAPGRVAGQPHHYELLGADGVSPLRVEEYPLSRTIRGEEAADVEVLVRHPGAPEGSWIAIQGCPLRDEDGKLSGGLVVARDVTERRRIAEDLRRAKEAAEAASRAKDQFLAILSHELRTPLTPVLMAVAALQEAPAEADLKPSLAMIRRNIELEARLIDDLLDVTRASAGKLALDLRPLDAHATIHQALAICAPEIRAVGLDLHLELEATESHVRADTARLQQVLWNLIQNATKFTSRGGSLRIRTRNAPGAGAARRLIIEVADDGIGIEPDVLPRIFEPFEQGAPALRRRFGGLGLGLTICRSVAEAHGGRLTAASAGRGHGTVFTLELATESAPIAAAPAAPHRYEEAPEDETVRILLVEDNNDTRRSIAWYLGQRHYRVRAAADLASARRLASSERFDLLLSDIELPDGTGLDLMRELQQAGPIAGIAMSGFGSEEDIRWSGEAGFATHLIKPIEARKLDAVIRQVVAGSRRAEPAPQALTP